MYMPGTGSAISYIYLNNISCDTKYVGLNMFVSIGTGIGLHVLREIFR